MDSEPYPPLSPFDVRHLQVSGGHTLYLEQVGNPKGIPAVVLHGGPGSGCQDAQRQWFDPAMFRVVLFDQRGAGRSEPKGSLKENTTPDLVADMEQIRSELGIERWLIVGGSWGATLGLTYAQAHPRRVSGLVLRAVFLGTPEEIQWAFADGPRVFRPDLLRALHDAALEQDRGEPIAALTRRLHGPDPADRDRAAHIWGGFERALSELRPDPPIPPALSGADMAAEPVPNTPRFESHYFRHGCFLEPGQLLRNAGQLAGIPGIIVQGRLDLLCPPSAAHALAAAWPDCELRLVEGAGHAVSEAGIAEALMVAIDDLGRRLP